VLALLVYVLACFVVDFVVVRHLDRSIDSRLATRLSQVAPSLPPGGPKGPIGSYSPQFSGDFDDTPIVRVSVQVFQQLRGGAVQVIQHPDVQVIPQF
jgi:hypothetical protein